VEFHAAAFGYRRQAHILVLINDISERKRAEAERLRLQEQMIRQNERLRGELSFARTVQQGLLPQRPPWSADRLATALRSLPASEVSRDFYTYVALDDGRMFVALGDVAGKGVNAALVMALMISAIESQARATPMPAAFLAALQTRLMSQLEACETFVSLLVALVDIRRRRITVANAGMPPLLLLRAGQARTVELSCLPLGIVQHTAYAEQSIDLLRGDRIVLLSDGVIEARNPYRELFGYERLERAFSLWAESEPPDRLIEGVLTTITTFIGEAEQHDDLTLLLLQPTSEF